MGGHPRTTTPSNWANAESVLASRAERWVFASWTLMQRDEGPGAPDAGLASTDDMGWSTRSGQTNWLVGVAGEKDEPFPNS